MRKTVKITLITAASILIALMLTPAFLIHFHYIGNLVYEYTGMTTSSTDVIFYEFCAILYGIGYLLGMTYQESSVYICIYLWPILLGATSLPILYNSVKYIIKKISAGSILHLLLSVAYVSQYALACIEIWMRYNQPTIPEKFNKCMSDLLLNADKIGLSYNATNLIFYVLFFAAMVGFNYAIYRIQKRYFFSGLTSRS